MIDVENWGEKSLNNKLQDWPEKFALLTVVSISFVGEEDLLFLPAALRLAKDLVVEAGRGPSGGWLASSDVTGGVSILPKKRWSEKYSIFVLTDRFSKS